MHYLDDIFTGFTGYKSGVRVQLYGVGKFSRQNRLQGFESVESISILDPLDVPARLDELRDLQDGWLEGTGKIPHAQGLDWLSLAFEQNYPDDLPLPYMFPTAEGGIQAEWTLGENEISLNINIERHDGEWHCLNIGTDGETARSLNLDESDQWEWFIGQIQRMSGGEA